MKTSEIREMARAVDDFRRELDAARRMRLICRISVAFDQRESSPCSPDLTKAMKQAAVDYHIGRAGSLIADLKTYGVDTTSEEEEITAAGTDPA